MKPSPLVGAEKSEGARSKSGWVPNKGLIGLVQWVGVAFFVLGAADVALTWYPTDFGNREWEFGTVTASFNGMPILILGLMLVLVGAAMTRRRWWVLGCSMVAAGLVAFVLAAVGLWATNVPLALEAVEGVILTGMKKALVKTTVQGAVYMAILTVIAFRGFMTFRQKDIF